MPKPSQVSLFKLLLRSRSLVPSPKSTYFLPSISLAPLPTQLGPNPTETPVLRFLHAPASNLHTLANPLGQNPRTRTQTHQTRRSLGTESAAELDVNKEVDTINLKFAEAREEIEMAMESKETVYFDE
ncbi:hypothetical protein Tsubulata_044377, partial [Turnera subulata]